METAVLSSVGSGGIDPPYTLYSCKPCGAWLCGWLGGAIAWLCVCVCWCWWASIRQKNSDFYPLKMMFFALFYVFLCH